MRLKIDFFFVRILLFYFSSLRIYTWPCLCDGCKCACTFKIRIWCVYLKSVLIAGLSDRITHVSICKCLQCITTTLPCISYWKYGHLNMFRFAYEIMNINATNLKEKKKSYKSSQCQFYGVPTSMANYKPRPSWIQLIAFEQTMKSKNVKWRGICLFFAVCAHAELQMMSFEILCSLASLKRNFSNENQRILINLALVVFEINLIINVFILFNAFKDSMKFKYFIADR